MAITKEEYALRLMPDFEVFDILERELLKNQNLSNGTLIKNDYLYYLIFKAGATQGIEIPKQWFRFALRSTRELKLDETFHTADNYTFIRVMNPSDTSSDYFYYVVLFDTNYIEKQQTATNIKLKFTPEDSLDTEILGVLI